MKYLLAIVLLLLLAACSEWEVVNISHTVSASGTLGVGQQVTQANGNTISSTTGGQTLGTSLTMTYQRKGAR